MCRGWERKVDMWAGEQVHVYTALLVVLGRGRAGVGRGGRQGRACSPDTTTPQPRSAGARIPNANPDFQMGFQGRVEYILFNSLIA